MKTPTLSECFNGACSSPDCLAMLNKRLGYSYTDGKSETYSYPLGSKLNNASQYGIDTYIGTPEIDRARMSVWVPIASGVRRDGVGDLLEVEGIRTERHRLNPISLFNHAKEYILPIGMACEWDEEKQRFDSSKYTSIIDPVAKEAKDQIFFYRGKGKEELASIDPTLALGYDKVTEKDHAQFCEQLFHMIDIGMVKGGSLGYQVIHAKQLQPDYETGAPAGMHLLSILKLEGSVVIMPANKDTIIKMRERPIVCGKRLSPYFVKSLDCYQCEKKAQLGYEGKSLPVPLEKLPDTKIPASNWKPGAGAVKELRQKYRTVKGLRRRLKRSSPGSSLIHVRNKDMSKLRQAAEAKGVKFQHRGPNGNLEKVRLTGDDNVIDELAKLHGVMKSLPTSENKTMPTDNPNDVPVEEVDETVELPEEEGEVEKYSLQILRRLHEDASLLLEQYDSLLGPLEHEAVATHLKKKLEALVSELEEVESLQEKHHPEAKLEETKDLEAEEPHTEDAVEDEVVENEENPAVEVGEDDTVDEADSAPEEEPPTPEEAVEGMHKKDEEEDVKSLRNQLHKALRTQYTKKLPSAGLSPNTKPKSSTPKSSKPKMNLGGMSDPRATKKKDLETNEKSCCGKKMKTKDCKCSSCMKSVCPACGKESCVCTEKKDFPEVDEQIGQVEVTAPDANNCVKPDTEPMQQFGKGLEDHEQEKVGQAAGFLQNVSQEQNFGDQHRMEAYHFHKSLELIGGKLQGMEPSYTESCKSFQELNAMINRVNVEDPSSNPQSKPKKDPMQQFGKKDMDTEEMQGQSDIQDQQTRIAGSYKSIGQASSFLARLSREKNFGDPHRQEAMMHGKALDAVSQLHKQDEKVEVTEPENTDTTGEVQEKEFPELEKQDSEVEVTKKNFPELKKEDRVVDLNVPTSPSKLGKKDPLQHFEGKTAKNIEADKVKSLKEDLLKQDKKAQEIDKSFQALQKLLAGSRN